MSWPPEVWTVLLAALPVSELRGALPVALLVYKLPVWEAFILSVIGNMLPIYFLMVFYDHFSLWLMKRSVLADRFFTWLFARTRHNLRGQIKRHGYWALAVFVAIPFPGTGIWTGALAAFVFGLRRPQAFLSILAGVVVAGFIMLAATLGGAASVQALLAW